VNVW
jgi:hypothetical protein